MTGADLNILQNAIDSSEKLGNLQASAVWAFFCLCLLSYLFWREKKAARVTAVWQDIRLEEAKAELLTATALQKLSDALERLEIIIDERLPRR